MSPKYEFPLQQRRVCGGSPITLPYRYARVVLLRWTIETGGQGLATLDAGPR